MGGRIKAFSTYVGFFAAYTYRVREILVGFIVLIMIGGALIAEVEGLKWGDGMYFSFVTGFTIGYGDIAPKTGLGRVISVGIGFTGMLFTGLNVAIAVRALADFSKVDSD